MPVAAAMDLMLEPGRLMAVRSRVSSSAKVVYFRIGITSHKIGEGAVAAFTFFLPEYKKEPIVSNNRQDRVLYGEIKQCKGRLGRIS